jgi:phage tail sheath protein FI
MAEKIVSPGVFTKENDLSFLQQGVADIGAAFIGPFKEGPLVPTIVNSQTEFEQLFGVVDDTYYTPLAVQKYLAEAGTATICRVAGQSGYLEKAPLLLIAASGSQSGALGILFNTSGSAVGFAGTTISDLNGSGDFSILLSGSGIAPTGYSSSIELADANNIEAVFGTSPNGEARAYSYAFFKANGFIFNTGSYTISSADGILSGAVTSSAFAANISASVVVLDDQKFSGSILLQDGNACEAKTPYIQSQLINNTRFPLFQFETITAGNVGNTKVKIGITNVKAAGTSNGTDYGTFTIVVRDFNDTDKKKNILETFSNVNLDPNSPNYINRVIGDRKRTINSTTGKITETGDWVNYSKYIRLVSSDRNPLLDSSKIPVQAVPFAHAGYQLPVNAGNYANFIPRVTFSTGSAVSGSTLYSGIDLDNNADNKIYMKPIPVNAGSGSNSTFSLDTICGLSLTTTDSSTIAMRQFIVAFQEGFDGYAPNTNAADIDASTTAGKLAYGTHIAALSNADEYDINMVVAPHVNRADHENVWTSILDMVEQRADAFFIGDAGNAATEIQQTLQQADGVDSNYAAVYYPWIKTLDVNTNKLITVPPSVLLPGVFAANDRIAAEWFAPAGLNRGGLVGAVSVLDRLTQSEKDTLYEGKVNPIVQFPGQGIVVFGQKTLQDKPSALDRINVRRLLLTVRKYIASTSRYLVFEQNTAETRNRFLNIVNPYLESIQQRQGLYAFRVVMDETNNTPDVIDRNIMKGAIYLQPTKTAEFIQIDFNILPTGAAFNG